MDKVGIHGDLWSEVRNRHSRRVYLILTQPDLGSDYWVTHIFLLVQKEVLFGLLTFTAMDFNRPLVAFRSKKKEPAYSNLGVRCVFMRLARLPPMKVLSTQELRSLQSASSV